MLEAMMDDNMPGRRHSQETPNHTDRKAAAASTGYAGKLDVDFSDLTCMFGTSSRDAQHPTPSPQQPQQQQQPFQVSASVTTVPVTDRVYLLGPWLEPIQGPLVPRVRAPQVCESRHPNQVSIKEVVYVDLESSLSSSSSSHNDAIPLRPFWVPTNVPAGNWSLDPACFWTVSSVPLTDLESGKANLLYNPMSDYSLELIRWYRPDLFEKLFLWFSQLNDYLYSPSQLDQINDLIRPEKVVIDDFEANFSDNSPAAATLKTAVWGDDVLPEVEHYMTLLHLRAYSRRDVLNLVK